MKFSLLFSMAVTGCTALAASPATKFRLNYFDIKGVAETSRLLFAIAGEDYEDTRYKITPGSMESPTFTADKEGGALAMNLGRAPTLITPEGVTIGQSKAIERFLARRFRLMGSSNGDETKAALVDCIAEHCRDVKDAQARKRFSMFVKDRTEEEKETDQTEWFTTDMPTLLAKIEASVASCASSKGHAVGSSISYADVSIFSLLRECFPAYEAATLEAASDCPLLLEICESVANHPRVSQWIEERPATPF